MSNLTPGDVGIVVSLNEQQAMQGAQRTMQALDQLDQVVRKLGADVDKAMGFFEKTAEATQGIKQLTEAEREEAAAARTAAEAHRKHQEEMRKASEEARKQKQELADLKAGLTQISAAAAAGAVAVAAAAKITTDAFKQEETALKGLESVSGRVGESFAAAQAAAENLASDGLMTLAEASRGLQALMSTGYNLDQSKEILQIAKDAAAFNRQVGFSIGEASVRMAEGIRLGMSQVSDAAGITKNLSAILREQGKSEQDVMNIQSDASVRQALLNGLRQEGALFAGNAAKAAQTLAGSEAQASNEAFRAKAAIGEALAPAVQAVTSGFTSLMGKVTGLAEANPELARTMFLVVGGVTAVTAALGTATVAMMSFNAAALANPIGQMVLSLGLAGGLLVAKAMEVKALDAAQQKHQATTKELADEYDRLNAIMESATAADKEKRQAAYELDQVVQKIGEHLPGVVTEWDEHGQALEINRDKFDRLADSARKAWEAITNGGKLGDGTTSSLTLQLSRLQMDRSDLAGRIGTAEQALLNKDVGTLNAMGLGLGNAGEAIERWKGQLSELDTQIDEVGAKLNRAMSMTGQDWVDRYLDVQTPGRPQKPDSGSPNSSSSISKMSPALAAALEDLQDLQAADKNADNLSATLAKVRSILTEHAAELAKLGKNRDLERLRDITLPKEILEADYRAAMQKLGAQQQLKEITPGEFSAGLKAIQEKFADYLQGHPEEALQMQLKIKGATDEELRAPFEAWQRQLRQNEQMGLYAGQNGMQAKLAMLNRGIFLADGANDADAVAQLTQQLRDLLATMQQARFDEKFDAIGKARERAFADKAGDLAGLERQLIDEEAKGDKADPTVISNIKQRMLDAVRPALEAEKSALEELLKDTTLTDKQIEQVERSLTSVKAELYDQDVNAHRIASDAKVAAERTAATDKQKLIELQQTWIRWLAEADMAAIRAGHKADEDRQANKVKGLRDQLAEMERIWAAEDRRNRRSDLAEELAGVKAMTNIQKVMADGSVVWTYDEERARELEKQIADADRDEQRAQQREALQSMITAEENKLTAMRTKHQEAEAERQRFWTFVEGLDLSKYPELTAAAEKGLGEWSKVFETSLDTLKGSMQTKADEIQGILKGITEAISSPALTAPKLPAIPAPTLPASLPASTQAAAMAAMTGQAQLPPIEQHITVTGVTNPREAAAAVKTAAAEGTVSGISEAVRAGRQALRAGLKPI